MANKPITNQRTRSEIREEVSRIDKEVPDTKEFVAIMEKEEGKSVEEVEEIVTPDIPDEDSIEVPEKVLPIEDTETEVELETEPALQKPQLPPIEQRYKEAGQEAMILNSKNRKIMETIEEAESLPEPTVDEVKAYAKELGEDYDNLESFAQNLLKRNLINERRFGKISSLVAEEKQHAAWIKKVENFLDLEDTQNNYPQLIDNRDEFIKYASKKTHMNAELDLLAGGFMWTKPSKPANKGSVLLPSSRGGTGNLPKPVQKTELNEDDAKVYRESNPKKYKQMIKNRKFKVSV